MANPSATIKKRIFNRCVIDVIAIVITIAKSQIGKKSSKNPWPPSAEITCERISAVAIELSPKPKIAASRISITAIFFRLLIIRGIASKAKG